MVFVTQWLERSVLWFCLFNVYLSSLLFLPVIMFLFFSGPQHPWLIQTYAQSVSYPFASILGQEIFQGGLVPSDTDYQIFHRYGQIPGW